MSPIVTKVSSAQTFRRKCFIACLQSGFAALHLKDPFSTRFRYCTRVEQLFLLGIAMESKSNLTVTKFSFVLAFTENFLLCACNLVLLVPANALTASRRLTSAGIASTGEERCNWYP